MCVCVFVCVYIYVCVCVYICMYVCMYMYIYVCMYRLYPLTIFKKQLKAPAGLQIVMHPHIRTDGRVYARRGKKVQVDNSGGQSGPFS